MKILLLLIPLFMLTSCMSDATQQRFTTEGSNVQSCQTRVLDARVKIAEFKSKQPVQQVVVYKDERNAMVVAVVTKMSDAMLSMASMNQKKVSDFDSCDDLIVAMVKADSQKTAGLMSIGKGAVNGTLAVLGFKIFADGFGPDAYSGTSQGDTFNVSGSRFNSKSGNVNGSGTANVSSSGRGLGIANTIDGSQGGITPRNINDITGDGVSNSGTEDAPVTLPVEPAP